MPIFRIQTTVEIEAADEAEVRETVSAASGLMDPRVTVTIERIVEPIDAPCEPSSAEKE